MTGRPESGFTLVEMAIVLIVIGLVMLTVFPALTALRSSTERSLTQSNLQALMQATASYVQSNGCLPCPTPAATIGAGFGRVRGDSGASPLPCGGCASPEGIPPFMSLGVPAGTAHDGWGHWITMRVDPALTVASLNGVVPPTVPVACTCALSGSACKGTPSQCTCPAPVNGACAAPFNASIQGLCAAGLPTSNRISVQTPNGGSTQQAAVIFVSHGASGFGSFAASVSSLNGNVNGLHLPFPHPVPCSATGGFAECNAAGTAQFVNAPTVSTGDDPYDDMLAFADRNTLVSLFGNGSCQSTW